jgi:hypothetical protein
LHFCLFRAPSLGSSPTVLYTAGIYLCYPLLGPNIKVTAPASLLHLHGRPPRLCQLSASTIGTQRAGLPTHQVVRYHGAFGLFEPLKQISRSRPQVLCHVFHGLLPCQCHMGHFFPPFCTNTLTECVQGTSPSLSFMQNRTLKSKHERHAVPPQRSPRRGRHRIPSSLPSTSQQGWDRLCLRGAA